MAFVAFLRRINVGGHRALRPKVLATALSRFDVVSVGTEGTFVVRQAVARARFLAELLRRLPFGVYRRHMKTIGYLGQIDRLFGAPVTTRSWKTMLAVVRILRGDEQPDR